MPEPLRLGLPREELAFSPGVIPALYQIVEDLVKPDHGKVLTMTPAYGFFLHACVYNGVELVTSPLRKVLHILDALQLRHHLGRIHQRTAPLLWGGGLRERPAGFLLLGALLL